MDNQLWYLSELVWLSLLEDRIDNETKRQAVHNLVYKENDNLLLTSSTTIDQLFNTDAWSNMQNLELNFQFLELDVDEWASSDNFKEFKHLFSSLHVTNDFCERICKQTKDFDKV